MNKYNDSPEDRARVMGKIARTVEEWCRLHIGKSYHDSALYDHLWVTTNGLVAPGSGSRIIRQLKEDGCIGYDVYRGLSLYVILWVNEEILKLRPRKPPKKMLKPEQEQDDQ